MPKTRIIPAILEQNAKQAATKLAKLATLTNAVHLDFMDGTLVDKRTLSLPQLLNLARSFTVDVHLMVSRPSQYFLTIAEGKVKTVVLHRESYQTMAQLNDDISQLKNLGVNPSISWWPESESELIKGVDSYQIMGVIPGESGQPMLKSTKTRAINLKRRVSQGVMITLDGGVTNQIINDYQNVIDRFVVNSYLFNRDPASQWRLLQAALQ